MSRFVLGLSAWWWLAGAVAPATAQVMVYNSGGFESPLPAQFVPGPLVGQDPVGPWIQDRGTSTADVQAAGGNPGQVVAVTRVAGGAGAAGGDTRWAVFKAVAAPQTVTVQWDMRVPQATGSQFYGPYFAVEAYDYSNGLSDPRLIGSAGIEARNGGVYYQQTATGFLTPANVTASFDTWHIFRMVMNYDGVGGGNYQVYFDNSLVHTEPFVDPGIFNFTAAPIAALAFQFPVTDPATAYFDNYRVTVGAVPEPTSLALAGVGVAGGLACRRLRRPARRQQVG